MKQILEKVFRAGVADSCEIVGAGPNNTYCWYETQIGPVKYGGQVIAAVLVAADVTERKWAQKTLQESEQRFRDLANLLPQTVFEIDMSGNFIFTNNAGLEHSGYIQADIDKGLNVLQLFIPEDQRRVMKDIEKVLKGEEFGSHEYTGLKKDGSTFRVLAYSSPIIHDEMIVGMRGIILDITERKLAEEQVAQRNRELAALNAITQTVSQSLDLNEILNKALDKILEILAIEHGGIYLFDTEANNLILTVSKGMSGELLEVITPVRIGRGIPGIVAQSGEPMLVESISDSIELIGKRIQETAIAERGKSVMCLPLQARGKVLGVMFTMTQDERVFSSQEQQLMVTISHAISTAIENTQLLEAESRVMASEEADLLRAAFLSSISHEIRTPLTEIKGFASTLIQPDVEWDAETQKDFLIGINQASDRLLDVIGDVLDMSKIQAGVLKLEKRPVRIPKLIERLSTKFDTPTWTENLRLQLPDDLPPVLADEERLGQVITNLVENAAREGVPITIEAEALDGGLTVSVIDSGKGIPPERLEKVFEHFDGLVENTEHRRSGSGLKLTICKGIVEAHGGRIWAESEVGRSSTFNFTLPVAINTESSETYREILAGYSR
jgi:PAS domain S-box-containing protein